MSTALDKPLAHDHVWQIESVDYDETGPVSRLGCSCGAVWFR